MKHKSLLIGALIAIPLAFWLSKQHALYLQIKKAGAYDLGFGSWIKDQLFGV